MNDVTGSIKLFFLVGMPAAGKTYWGRRLARQYGLEFIDLDEYIVHQEGSDIPDLFARRGEQEFRRLESRHLHAVISHASRPTIIACGGGTPCFFDNMQHMKSAGTVIYLRAGISFILNNLNKGGARRPLLQDKEDIVGYLSELLHHRRRYYEQAHHILSAEDVSFLTFEEILLSCINRP
jgi:shikimate kinase